MRRLLFLSAISVPAVGCGGGDSCGPAGAPDTGLLASAAGITMTYGSLRSGANNDCPDPMAPSGVISLTIEGMQTDGTGNITVCIPRIDLLDGGSAPLGTSNSTGNDVRIIDLGGTSNNCTFTLSTGSPPTGQAEAAGVCANGTSSAGFALTFDGAVTLNRNCAGTMDNATVTLRGKVAVKPM
jgi:hypothetical protein